MKRFDKFAGSEFRRTKRSEVRPAGVSHRMWRINPLALQYTALHVLLIFILKEPFQNEKPKYMANQSSHQILAASST